MLDSPVLAWIAVAILAAIVEVSIPHFGVIFVSAGALVAALATGMGLSGSAQVIVFAVSLGLSLWLIRPRIVRHLGAPGVPSRTEQLIGREGVVTQDIDSLVGAGRVNIGGEDWAARATTPLSTGTTIRVAAADGIVLEVIPK